MPDPGRPRIAVTMGDPAGIGPEICLLALTNPDITRACIPFIFGDAAILLRVADEAGLEPPQHVIPWAEWEQSCDLYEKPAVVDLGVLPADAVTPGTMDARCGQASYEYITRAIQAALAGQVDGVTTAPIHKEALRASGVDFPGHTEIFAAQMGAERSCMMLTSELLTCSFVTVHVGLRDVPGLITEERVREVIKLTDEAMRLLRGNPPKIVVCGLNPHAGEHGLFGDGEEERFIAPAVQWAKEQGIDIEGPVPPDTAFLASRRRDTDAYVCMYHDQGLIPLKALAFEDAINITLGLPKVRTSVDHGTAFDIAWKGRANPNSLFEAILLAARLAVSAPASTRSVDFSLPGPETAR